MFQQTDCEHRQRLPARTACWFRGHCTWVGGRSWGALGCPGHIQPGSARVSVPENWKQTHQLAHQVARRR